MTITDSQLQRWRELAESVQTSKPHPPEQVEACREMWLELSREVLALLDEVQRLRAENEALKMREPTLEEMRRHLGERDEIQPGDAYPPGWPTIRRCRHCRVPLPGGPTACMSCVQAHEVQRLRATVETWEGEFARLAESTKAARFGAAQGEPYEAVLAERDQLRAERDAMAQVGAVVRDAVFESWSELPSLSLQVGDVIDEADVKLWEAHVGAIGRAVDAYRKARSGT